MKTITTRLIIIALAIFWAGSLIVVYAATTVTVADEVYGNNNPGRIAAIAGNDQWIANTKTAGLTCFYQLTAIKASPGNFTDTGAGNTNAEISGQLGNSTLTISNRDMNNFSVITDKGALGGEAKIKSSLGKSLQDSAPMPDKDPAGSGGVDGWYRVNNNSAWEYWSELSGSGTSRNAVLFEFNPPVHAFGAFFGDLETRTDGFGTPAELRYKIAGGGVFTQTISTSTSDQSQCGNGGTGGGNFPGCGNRSTRWIGLRDDVNTFEWIIIIVGDDDNTGGTQGNTEHISWVGATIAEAPQGGACSGPNPTASTLLTFRATPTSSKSSLLSGFLLLFLALAPAFFSYSHR